MYICMYMHFPSVHAYTCLMLVGRGWRIALVFRGFINTQSRMLDKLMGGSTSLYPAISMVNHDARPNSQLTPVSVSPHACAIVSQRSTDNNQTLRTTLPLNHNHNLICDFPLAVLSCGATDEAQQYAGDQTVSKPENRSNLTAVEQLRGEHFKGELQVSGLDGQRVSHERTP